MAGDTVSEAPLTILVVEDSADTLALLSTLLQKYGYRVLEAEDGLQGLRKAEAEKPPVIIIDLTMPELDGIEAVRRIRAIPALSHVLIIAMSAYLNQDVISEAFAAGCDDVFSKPLDFKVLLGAIRERLPGAPAPAS